MRRTTSRRIKGIGASPGIAQGTVFVVNPGPGTTPQFHIEKDDIPAELDRFENAVAESAEQIRMIRDRLSGADGGEHLLILEAHLLMLNDAIFIEGVKSLVREELINPEWALRRTIERIRSMFEGLAHDYFRERGSDIDFVGERIMRNLLGHKEVFATDELPDDAVVVAHDLSPADTAQLTRFKVRALITEAGSRTSHAAIVARSLDIPAVVGVTGILQYSGSGDRIVVDGFTGEIILQPTKVEQSSAKDSEHKQRARDREVIGPAMAPAFTTDGYRVKVLGNIELPFEAEHVLSHGGEGVGLYRTEFLFIGRQTPPSEEEHYEQYKHLAKICGNDRVITVRTLDVGGDKLFDGAQRPNERNPALGLRAIRLCLAQPDLLRNQLRAVLRAAPGTQMRLLLPMITEISELRSVRTLIDNVRGQLVSEGIPTADKIQLGIMIETPATAVIADMMAKHVDFFAIGTNDLIQYSLAIDRGNENVAYLYRPLHPAILRLISQTVAAASEAGIGVSICGEMASEMVHTPVLLGLGVTELSMNATAIPWVKRMVRDSSMVACRQLVDELMQLTSPLEVEDAVRAFVAQHYPKMEGSHS